VCCYSTSGVYFLALTVAPYICCGAIELVFNQWDCPVNHILVKLAILANSKPLKSGLQRRGYDWANHSPAPLSGVSQWGMREYVMT
jgi:hypothetical protein